MFQRIRISGAVIFLALLLAASLPVAAASTGQVNINTANLDQLELLPRVGPAIAKRIVEFREKNGPFKASEQMMLVRGIGEKTFDLLEPYVSVSGETTLKDKVRSSRTAKKD